MERDGDRERDSRARQLWRRLSISWRVKGFLGVRRQVLVTVRWRLGDEIMELPIYEALRGQFPECRIGVLCNYPDLLIDSPFVDAVNDPSWRADRWIDLRSGPRDVYRIEHYAKCAGVPTPVARPTLYYRDWTTPLLEGLPSPFVAVSSGASWTTKRWSVEHWRALCRGIESMGYGVVELGRGDERIGVGVSLMDKTTVREAACVLHAARLFVCCDSGLMHLALAARTNTVALFGPTEPGILARDEPRLMPVRSNAPCLGCWNTRREALEPGVCPLDRAVCLEGISSDRVLACVREMLAHTANGGSE